MNEIRDPKEMRNAVQARLALMLGGVFLMFTAITSTLMYGVNLFSISAKVAEGDSEYVEALANANITPEMLRISAICFLILAVIEIVAGFFAFRLCNRMDKALLSLKISGGLLIIEAIMQIFLLIMHLFNLGTLITALLLPLYMLYGANKMFKLHKAYPERVHAVNTQKGKYSKRGPAAKPEATKSLRERAMMNASEIGSAEETSEETNE